MIKIRHYINTHEIRLEGHAGYAKVGQDIVCASVSTVFYILVNALHNEYNQMLSEEPVVVSLCSSGEKLIKATPKADKESRAKIDDLFEVASIGFEMIAVNYPDNVSYEKIFL